MAGHFDREDPATQQSTFDRSRIIIAYLLYSYVQAICIFSFVLKMTCI